MNIEIKKLSPELAADYLEFFGNPQSSDDPLFAGCYCVWHHWTDELEHERSQLPEAERKLFKRNFAAHLIETGQLNGLLAYADGRVVGWCNADAKGNYARQWTISAGDEKTFAIVCYVVHPAARRKGIATALLKAACTEAKEKGYSCIEAYPDARQYSMYTRQGFELTQNSTIAIARKIL